MLFLDPASHFARAGPVSTDRTPTVIDVGFSHEEIGSPAALPTGTRPEAIAPTTVPMKNGVTTEETAKARSAKRWPETVRATLWKANPEPRSTIPKR